MTAEKLRQDRAADSCWPESVQVECAIADEVCVNGYRAGAGIVGKNIQQAGILIQIKQFKKPESQHDAHQYAQYPVGVTDIGHVPPEPIEKKRDHGVPESLELECVPENRQKKQVGENQRHERDEFKTDAFGQNEQARKVYDKLGRSDDECGGPINMGMNKRQHRLINDACNQDR